MKNINDVDVTGAAQTLAVANTPFFLLRKLKVDPLVHEISEIFSEDDILYGLKLALDIYSTEPSDAVRPYVYLAALSKKSKPDALRIAAAFRADRWAWYPLIASSLLETYSKIITQDFTPSRIVLPSASPASGVPVQRIIFER